jgi:hypothetical protein
MCIYIHVCIHIYVYTYINICKYIYIFKIDDPVNLIFYAYTKSSFGEKTCMAYFV